MMLKRISLFLLMMIIIKVNAQQWGDYTLYSVQNSSTAALLDTNGTSYHSWTFATNKKTGYSSYMLPGGNIIRSISNTGNQLNGGGMTGAIQISDWNGNTVWDFVYSSSTYCLHHDFCPLPNGNVLLISYDVKSASEMTAAGSSIAHTMWLEKIIEVQPTGLTTGDIVWEWHVYDHLCQTVNAAGSNYVTSALDHPELWDINYDNTAQTTDWMHMNGIDYNPDLDQIVFSSHMLDEMYIIDHSTTTAEAATHSGGNAGHGGDILYRWGNPAVYGGTGNAVLNVVHDAHFIPSGCPNAGFIVGFNNNGVSNSISCVDLVDTPNNGFGFDITPGATLLPTSFSLRQNCNGHTNNMGNSEQFPNGNMMICIAQQGTIYEIDQVGNVLWTKTISGTVPQAHRYTACFIEGTTPETPVIQQVDNVLTASTGTYFQWYLNGAPIAGANSQTYTVVENGTYQVASGMTSACQSALSSPVDIVISTTGEWGSTIFDLYPNPCPQQVKIVGIQSGPYSIFNGLGECMEVGYHTGSLDMSKLPSGLYHVICADGNGKNFTKHLLKQ